MLLDGMFTSSGGYFWVYLDAPSAIDRCVTIGDRLMHGEQSHVGAVSTMGMRRIDHLDPSAAADLQRLNQPRDHGASRWSFQPTTRRDKVVLHIHNDHRRLGGFDSLDFHLCPPRMTFSEVLIGCTGR